MLNFNSLLGAAIVALGLTATAANLDLLSVSAGTADSLEENSRGHSSLFVINTPQAALLRYNLTTQGKGSGNVVQGFAQDPYTNELYTLHITGSREKGVLNKFDALGKRKQTSYRYNSTPNADIGHQELDISWDKDGERWFWTGENKGVTNQKRYIKRFQVSDGEGSELTISNVEQYQVWGTDVTGNASSTVSISLDGRYLVTEYNQRSQVTIRVFNLSVLQAGGAGDYSANYLYEWTFALSEADYPLQSMACDGSFIYIFTGNIATGNKLKVFVYSIAGDFIQEIDDFIVGKAEALRDDTGTDAYELEGAGWIWHGGKPMLAASIASGDSGSRTNRIWIFGANRPGASGLSP